MSLLENAYSAVFGKPVVAASPSPAPVPSPSPSPSPSPTPAPAPPLDKLKGTWDTPVPPTNAPTPPPNFLDNINEENVNKAAKGVDFRKTVTQEVFDKVAKGGSEGVQAILDAMNTMNQDVYGKGALATGQIVKKALQEQKDAFLKELPKLIRDQSIKGASKKANPLFDNPALKPISSALETTFAAQHPNASAEEVAAMVNDYFTTVASVLAPKTPNPKTARTKDGTDDIDWEEFASKDS